jgi:hypothetical protein
MVCAPASKRGPPSRDLDRHRRRHDDGLPQWQRTALTKLCEDYDLPRSTSLRFAAYAALAAMLERIAVIVCGALSVRGCFFDDPSYVRAIVADPSKVTVANGGSVALPTNGDLTVAQGSAEDPHGGADSYEIRVRRETTGAVKLEWWTKLPLTRGGRLTLVEPNGIIVDDEDRTLYDRITLATTLSHRTFRIDACPRLVPVAKFFVVYAYRTSEWSACDTPRASRSFALETPWSNVIELRKHRGRYDWLSLGVLGGGLFAGLGILGLEARPQLGCGGDKGCNGVAIGMIGLGVLLLGGGAYEFFSSPPPADEVVYRRE